MRRTRNRTKVALLILAVMVVLSGLLLAYRYFNSTSSTVISKQIGYGVTVTGNNLPENLQATISKAQVQYSPKLATLVSPTYQIGPTGKLSSPITIQLPLTRFLPTGSKLIVMTSESANGPWTPLAAILSKDGKSVSFSASHLSFFDPLWLDLEALANAFKNDFLDPFVNPILSSARPPSCQNRGQALQGGYSVSASSKEGALSWCFGLNNGKRELVVVNNRRYFLDVQYPGLTAISHSTIPLGLLKLDEVAVRSQHEILIPPGDEYRFGADIPKVTQASVKTQSDAGSRAIALLEVSVEAVTAVIEVGILLGAPIDIPAALVIVSSLLLIQDCGNAVAKAFAPGFVFGDFLKACLTPENIALAYGSPWGIVAEIIVAIPDVFGFLLTQADTSIEQFLKLDRYQVNVTNALPSACPNGSGTCLGIHTGDIDGDGRPDQVGVTFLKGSDQFVVHVILATGQVLTYVVKPPTLPKDTYTSASFLGLTDIDGSGKDEIVVRPIGCDFSCGYTILELLQGALQPMPFYGGGEVRVFDDVVGAFVCSTNGSTHQVTVYNEYVTPGSVDVYQADGKGGMRFVSRSVGLQPPVPSGANCPGLSVN